jgi:beta-glucuronidase
MKMKQRTELRHWHFSIDALGYERDVCLPHTWNVDGREDVQLYRGRADYRATVSLPSVEGKTAALYFGCAYHTAEVSVNGRAAGVHTGSGNTPFEIDVTGLLRAGENEIHVAVDNAPKEEMLPHMLDYDWADDGGLTRDAALTLYDRADLRRLDVAYDIEEQADGRCGGVLRLSAECVPQEAAVELIDWKSGETVLAQKVFLEGGVSVPFQGLKLWSPDSPSLYTVRVRTDGDVTEKRIGLRKIEVEGERVLLNGSPVYLAGCEWMPGSHPDFGMAEPLSHSVLRLSQLKRAGCVFTRFHWQQDTSLFDWCDENGLLVQEEIPYWGRPKKAGPLQLRLAKEHADAMVRWHGHHPSIICWGVGNELDGAAQEMIRYVEEMYRYFKALDGSRLVNYVSNTVGLDQNVERDEATLHGDIAMWNEYLGLWQRCDSVEGVIRRTFRKFEGMPGMATEFGLCEPAYSGGDARRIAILEERIPIYRSLPGAAGYVAFSLNDYRTHCGEAGEGKLRRRVHGSTDLYGEEKPSYRVLARLNGAEPLGPR